MATEGKQSFARRDEQKQIELDVQKKWDELKVFEEDAPTEKDEKFMCTFPYPYMNGLLHLGHAFTLTKAVFAAQFQRLLGKKVLFPFGFHCTGMPIQAAANKLKREYETYGDMYPKFPAGMPMPKAKDGVPEMDGDCITLLFKAPPCTGNVEVKAYSLQMSVAGGAFKEVLSVPPPSKEDLLKQGKKVICKVPIVDGGCVFKVLTKLVDGSSCPESKESAEVNVDAAPKDKKSGAPGGGKRVAKKILAKTGDAAFQWEILVSMGLKPEDLLAFVDPMHWLQYYPPLGVRDLKRFAAPIDFRRSFITTSVNPFYDKFIRWQFHKLKASDKIGFGQATNYFLRDRWTGLHGPRSFRRRGSGAAGIHRHKVESA
jgi:leucyl-tRNA synthetase